MITNEDIQWVNNKIADLENQSLTINKKKLMTISFIIYLLKKAGLNPLIVGGFAVEFYTDWGIEDTLDIDLIVPGRELANEIFNSLGFIKPLGQRHWFNKEIDLAIEIPDDTLAGSIEKVRNFTVEGIFNIDIIGIEDLILDRLKAAVYWKSKLDREYVLNLLKLSKVKIDLEYLEKKLLEEPEVYKAYKDLRVK